jgi:DNA polymerase III delta prime subunit
MDEHLWAEKYRPKKVDDCILPARLKTLFKQYVAQGEIPNLMFYGTAGVGKTTVARALCEEIGVSYLFIPSSEERGIDTFRVKVHNYASTLSLGGTRKVIILDEADGLTPDAQKALRGAVERYSTNCTFILTCNTKAMLHEAIHSRCAGIDFALTGDERPKMASQFLKRIEDILKKENVTYDRAVLFKIVEKYFPDYRRTLGELQRFGTAGAIDAGTLAQVSALRNFDGLIQNLKDKNFGEMRKWVVANYDVDPTRIFRKIYDGLYDVMMPADIPMAVVIIDEYQYRAAFVADHEINLVAFLTEIMVKCEFK